MQCEWKNIFSGHVDGQLVGIEHCAKCGYRISTFQKENCMGDVVSDDVGVTIFPPTAQGGKIVIENNSLEGALDDLNHSGFSADAVAQIRQQLEIELNNSSVGDSEG